MGWPKLHGACLPRLVVMVQVGLLAWSASRHSPLGDEVGHLPAAVAHWREGVFDLYRVNPPLTRLIAGFPAAVAGAKLDWSPYRSGMADRPEGEMGKALVRANPGSWYGYLVAGRLALLGLVVSGGWG